MTIAKKIYSGDIYTYSRSICFISIQVANAEPTGSGSFLDYKFKLQRS